MRSEHGQGTVEYVGIVLVVAVLLGAIAGGLGASAGATAAARSIVAALVRSLGGDAERAPRTAEASAADQARFAAAIDTSLPPDDRPSLRDVRLGLIASHGVDQGLEIFRRLVVANVRQVVPGLGAAVRFATAVAPPVASGKGFAPPTTTLDARRSLSRPGAGDAGEYERAVGAPDVHVVTVSDADASIAHALQPDVSPVDVAIDVAGILPGGSAVTGGGRVARAISLATGAVGAYSTAQDIHALLPDGETAIAPGFREGDELVSWTAVRTAVATGDTRTVERTAVVRDGVVIHEGIAFARPPGTTGTSTPGG